jgi:hypothetical protein
MQFFPQIFLIRDWLNLWLLDLTGVEGQLHKCCLLKKLFMHFEATSNQCKMLIVEMGLLRINQTPNYFEQ